MKQILFILLAIISLSSQAQSHYVHYLDGSFYGVIKDNSDTFEIQHLGNIRFIKIEGEIYEITRKTELKKVEPQSMNSEWFAVPNYNAPIYGGNGGLPIGSLTDRSTNDTMLIYNANKGEWMNPPKKKSKKK